MKPVGTDAPAFRGLGEAVADVREPLFIDFVHVSETANDLIVCSNAAAVAGAIAGRADLAPTVRTPVD